MYTTKGFIFDYSKCVGCHACIVACYAENTIKPPMKWRQVLHYNKEKLPLLGFIHLSIACNHCSEAPCLKACPSGAYSFDIDTKAVIHSPELCIGCKYCTWACPFDAPKYNNDLGVIEKCNFCNHRLKENESPACALNCPTGALSFGEFPIQSNPDAIGVSRKEIYPRLKVVGSDTIHSVPISDVKSTGVVERDIEKFFDRQKNQLVNPLNEFPLALFTFIGSMLSGWIWALNLDNTVEIGFIGFGLIGLVALVLSTIHLGKPFRAYLSIKNIRSSWLSREILLFGIFLLFSLLALWFESGVFLIVASILALLFLISIEKVYSTTNQKYNIIHSANTLYIAFTFAALFTQSWTVLIVILSLKTLFFILKHGIQQIVYHRYISFISFFRLMFGLIIPFGYLLLLDMSFSWYLAGSIILGEAIDRLLYYSDFVPERPFDKVRYNN